VSRRVGLAVAAACLTLAGAGAAYSSTAASASSAQPTAGKQLPTIRAATAKFHSLGAAQHAGWNTLFQDVNGLTCIEDTDTPSMGGMGFHWINGANIGSSDPLKPAALIYAPSGGGNVRFAGMEYLVPDPDGTTPQPFLNGVGFMHTEAPNRFLGDTPFWSLHVWAWDHNPMGTYAMWNPKITCP
jgi:hypothetical protein